MKVAFLLFFVAFLAFTVEPGKASHSKKHQKNVKNEEGADSEVGDDQGTGGWPTPGAVNDFTVPQSFLDNIGIYDGGDHEESQSGKQHHGKSGHRGRKN